MHQHPHVKLLIAHERHRDRLAAAERDRLVRDAIGQDDAPDGRRLVPKLVRCLWPTRPRPTESAA